MPTTKARVDETTQPVEPMAVRVERAAELMGVSRAHVFRLIAAGELRSIKTGARRLVPMAALRDWLDRNSA